MNKIFLSRFLFLLILSLSVAALSIGITGFEYGSHNNVYHIPYVLRFESLPQFVGDAYYQSLRNFTSVIWPLIRSVATDENISELFFLAHAASRWAAFAAILWLAISVGCQKGACLSLVLVVCATSYWLTGVSPVGHHHMFIYYFTHSEVTWAPLLGAIIALSHRRLYLASLLSSLTLAINVFVGLWLVAILISAVLFSRDHRFTVRQAIGPFLTYFLLSLPIIVWVFSAINSDPGKIVDEFSYIDYIRLYFKFHFLIEAATYRDIFSMLFLVWIGIISGIQIERSRFWVGVIIGCSAILFVGAWLPYLVNARFIFNLHLLRVDGVVLFLAVALGTIVATRTLLQETGDAKQGLAAAALMAFLLQRSTSGILVAAIALTGIFVLTRASIGQRPGTRVRRLEAFFLGTVGVLLVSIAVRTILFKQMDMWQIAHVSVTFGMAIILLLVRRGLAPRALLISVVLVVLTGYAVGRLARTLNEPPRTYDKDASFIDLTSWIKANGSEHAYLTPSDEPFGSFQHTALRPTWVEWKQGAAVMWQPSFYKQWASRFLAVQRLQSDAERINYARENGIVNVVLRAPDCPDGVRRIYTNREYSVCELK